MKMWTVTRQAMQKRSGGNPHPTADGFHDQCWRYVMVGANLWAAGPQQQTTAKSWRLATADTELELAVTDGSPMLQVLRSTATHRNWLASPRKESLMKSVLVNGVAKELDWHFEGADLDAKGEQLTLHFSNASPKLSLDSVWRARAGRGPAEHWVTIANQSDGAITVTQQESLALDQSHGSGRRIRASVVDQPRGQQRQPGGWDSYRSRRLRL